MIVLIFILLGTLVAIFTAQIHGYIGAIILGADAIGFDILWQWMRFTFLKNKSKSKTSHVLPGIIVGFILRIISIIAFLKLASWWLTQNEFYVFAIFLLTIPIWSKLVAVKLKTKE
jgi:hypothetical protein